MWTHNPRFYSLESGGVDWGLLLNIDLIAIYGRITLDSTPSNLEESLREWEAAKEKMRVRNAIPTPFQRHSNAILTPF